MGLISLIKGAAGGFAGNVASTIGSSVSSAVADQYQEFFTCDSLGDSILVRRGANRVQKGNNKGSSEVISQGSIVAVPEGTALLLVDGGQIVDFTTEAGYYRWDNTTSPSVFANKNIGENIKKTVVDAWDRMRMGGEIPKQQRVYFINMLEMRNQNFGTPSPVPYNDPVYASIYIRMNGTFSYKIVDPVTFFRNITGNIGSEYTSDEFMGTPSSPKQPRLEFLDRITEALNGCGGPSGISFNMLPSQQGKFRTLMQDCLDQDWLQGRGIVVESVAITPPTPDDSSRKSIEEVDKYRRMGGLTGAAVQNAAILGQVEAMNTAAGNSNGPANAFAGIGMMGAAGAMNMANNQNMGIPGLGNFAQNPVPNNPAGVGPGAAAMGAGVAAGAMGAAAAGAAAGGWTCSCGHAGNQGNFCANCGSKKPEPAADGAWTCECGTSNTGKFCSNCGKQKPEAAGGACPKCGWKPADGNMPKFCPECGTQLQ